MNFFDRITVHEMPYNLHESVSNTLYDTITKVFETIDLKKKLYLNGYKIVAEIEELLMGEILLIEIVGAENNGVRKKYTVNVNTELSDEFSIFCVGSKVTCTCKDYKYRHKICKHIVFVLCKVCGIFSFSEIGELNAYQTDYVFKLLVSNAVQCNEYISIIAKNKPFKKLDVISKNDNCCICLNVLDTFDVLSCPPSLISSIIHLTCITNAYLQRLLSNRRC